MRPSPSKRKIYFSATPRSFPCSGAFPCASSAAASPACWATADAARARLLNLVMGLSRPSSGVVKINGAEAEGPGTDRAIVFQDCSLFPWMTAQENVAFAIRHARKITKQASAALAADFLSQVGLYESRGKYPNQLSGGMKQRVAIARALAMGLRDMAFRRAVQRARPADAPLAPVARLRPREVREAAHGALRHAQRRRGRDARRADTLHERRRG